MPKRYRRRTSTLTVEVLESRQLMATLPLGAMPDDTGEFMLGDVGVTVVLMESDSSLAPRDASTEDWTPSLIQGVKTKVDTALNWWKDTLAKTFPAAAGDLNFVVDYQYADNPVRTGYEPINRKSDDFVQWMYDFLRPAGYSQTGDFSRDIRAFNHAQRQALQTNWSFTIFVVNSTVDPDDSFASGGTFSRAFSYAGGRFMIVPSGRPDSTFAHETGHMFWGRDEYLGEDFTARRGYYNTQNFNAVRNGYTQVPSIMSSGQSLADAFSTNTSSTYTLAMIGWQDSDGDGILDVLDVPLTLTGDGRYNEQTGLYRFTGQSAVQTLPNQNSAGLQNDITINLVSRAEYRIDGGAWTLGASPGVYQANLDFSFPVPAGSHTVEVRTVDAKSGASSPIFQGTTNRPTTTLAPGIQGVVWQDIDGDSSFDNNETGLANWTIELLDANGQRLNQRQIFDPDAYSQDSNLKNVFSGVTITANGPDTDRFVYAVANPLSGQGGRVFGTNDPNTTNFTGVWTAASNRANDDSIRIDFASPQTTVSVDATGFDGNDFARLEAYDASGRLLLRTTSQSLASQQTETLTVSRDQADIAYVVAKPHISGSAVVFDRLQFGAITSTKTAVGVSYRLPSLPAGDYTVRATPPAGFTLTGPTPGNIQVTLGAGEASSSVDFGAQGVANTWHNSNLPEDVNDDQVVVPLDALLVVNDLNLYGSRALPSPGVGPQAPPPYLDVNADGFISPIDALRIINRLNGGSGGEASASASASASLNTSTSDAALLGYLTVPGDDEEHHHHHHDEELHDQDWALGAVPENKLDATKLTPPSISPPATSDIDTALSQLILTPRSFFRRWLAR
ncbi:MAG: dockerin type I domain-containing protein [Planctomycetota bacterium]